MPVAQMHAYFSLGGLSRSILSQSIQSDHTYVLDIAEHHSIAILRRLDSKERSSRERRLHVEGRLLASCSGASTSLWFEPRAGGISLGTRELNVTPRRMPFSELLRISVSILNFTVLEVPDVCPFDVLPESAELSMAAGEFVDVYKDTVTETVNLVKELEAVTCQFHVASLLEDLGPPNLGES
eukprot:5499131-Amphidinium_carterae.1